MDQPADNVTYLNYKLNNQYTRIYICFKNTNHNHLTYAAQINWYTSLKNNLN